MCRHKIARELGIRSDALRKRIGAIRIELARMKREFVRNDMNLPAINVEHAEDWLAKAQKNWDESIKW